MTDKEFKRAYYLANRDSILKKQKDYYERNKEARREYQRKYFRDNYTPKECSEKD